jgi:hypothetical protein
MPAGLVQHVCGQFGRLAEANRHDARQARAGGQDRAGLALATLEFRRRKRTCDRAAGRLIGLLPYARRHFAFAHQQNHGAGLWQGRLGEGDVEHGVETPLGYRLRYGVSRL